MKKLYTAEIIGIIVIIVFLVFAIPLIIMEFKQCKVERECYTDIAKDFCEERGLNHIGMNSANTFFVCGDNRTILEEGDNYKFTNEERDYCYHLATNKK